MKAFIYVLYRNQSSRFMYGTELPRLIQPTIGFHDVVVMIHGSEGQDGDWMFESVE